MMWGASEGMGWWMVFGMVFWIVLVGAVVYLVARTSDGLGQSRQQRPPATPHHETPLEIAQRRYASGEITEDEFRRLRENLLG